MVRLEIAAKILAALAVNAGEGYFTDKNTREKWVGIALEWADELIKQGEVK